MTTPPLKEASFPYSSSVLSGISKPNVDKLIVPRVPENEENPPKGFSNQYVSGKFRFNTHLLLSKSSVKWG